MVNIKKNVLKFFVVATTVINSSFCGMSLYANANFDYAKEYDLWLTRADVNYGDYPEAHNNFLKNGNPYRTFKQYETEDGAYYSGYYYLVD